MIYEGGTTAGVAWSYESSSFDKETADVLQTLGWHLQRMTKGCIVREKQQAVVSDKIEETAAGLFLPGSIAFVKLACGSYSFMLSPGVRSYFVLRSNDSRGT